MFVYCYLCFFYFFKQKTAYEMRISDWSSDVCSSDLGLKVSKRVLRRGPIHPSIMIARLNPAGTISRVSSVDRRRPPMTVIPIGARHAASPESETAVGIMPATIATVVRSEEHTSELQSLMRSTYAVFCLKTTKHHTSQHNATKKNKLRNSL